MAHGGGRDDHVGQCVLVAGNGRRGVGTHLWAGACTAVKGFPVHTSSSSLVPAFPGLCFLYCLKHHVFLCIFFFLVMPYPLPLPPPPLIVSFSGPEPGVETWAPSPRRYMLLILNLVFPRKLDLD